MSDTSAESPDWMPEAKLVFNVAAAFVPQLAILPAFAEYLEDCRNRQARNLALMSETAVNHYSGSAEELLQGLQADPQLVASLDTALTAATRASTEDKARALGLALASGALAVDDAQVDEAAQMLRIIADLEPVDVKVLDALTRIDAHHPKAKSGAGPTYITSDDLPEVVVGYSTAAAQGAIAVLQRHGLVVAIGGLWGGGTGWYVSELGNAVLTLMHKAANR